MTIGCQMFQGLPRSYMSPTATRMYPRNAVMMVGRTIGLKRFRLKT